MNLITKLSGRNVFHVAVANDALRDDPRWSAALKAAGASPDELAELTFEIPPLS